MKKTLSPRTIALIGMLTAIAAVLMILDFPIVFIAPTFYKFDFSEIPVLIGAFSMGPLAGVIIELIKVLLNFLLNGTVTGGVGELANFIMGCAFILPAGIIYKFKHNKKGAFIGLVAGTIVLTAVGSLINAFVLLPVYSQVFGMDISAFVAMGSEIFSSVDSLATFVLFCVAPFNLFKGVICSIITALLYKKVSYVIKAFRDKRI